MGRVSDLALELRNHAVDDHTRGCGGRTYSCECGYDSKTERLLRAAAQRIEHWRPRCAACASRSTARTNRSDLHTRRIVRVAKKSSPIWGASCRALSFARNHLGRSSNLNCSLTRSKRAAR